MADTETITLDLTAIIALRDQIEALPDQVDDGYGGTIPLASQKQSARLKLDMTLTDLKTLRKMVM